MYLFQRVCEISGFPSSETYITCLQDTTRKIDPVGYFRSFEMFSVFEKVQTSRPNRSRQSLFDVKKYLMLERCAGLVQDSVTRASLVNLIVRSATKHTFLRTK